MRPPICEVCGADLDPRNGLISFVGDERTAEFRRRAETPGFVGHPPNQGWFCPTHHAAATALASSMTLGEVVRQLSGDGQDGIGAGSPVPEDRPAPSPAATTPSLTRESLRPDHAASVGLVPVGEWTIAPRSGESTREVVRDRFAALTEALDVGGLRSAGSIGSVTDDPADLAHAPAGTVTTSDSSRYDDAGGRPTVFVVDARHHDGDRLGPVRSQHLRILVLRRMAPTYEITVAPALTPTIAGDGVTMLERLTVRTVPAFDHPEALHRWTADLVEALGAPAFDPLDPAPDLVDVGLGTGTITRFGHEQSLVTWKPQALQIGDVADAMVTAAPALTRAAIGAMENELTFATSSERTWDPMDGAQPPHCPFTDTRRWTATAATPVGPVEIVVLDEAAHWSDDHVANRIVTCSITGEQRRFRLFAHDGDSSDARVTLGLYRPTTAAVVEVVRSVFDVG